jgi:hypothetical protein
VEFSVERESGVVTVIAVEPNPPEGLVAGRYEREVRMTDPDLRLLGILGGQ